MEITMTPEERKALIAEIVEVMNSTKPQLSDEEVQEWCDSLNQV